MADFLRVDDRSADELLSLVDAAAVLEAQFRERRLPALLEGQRVAMWWDGPGFRNRVAFELGVDLLGGTAIEVPGRLAGGEAIGDVGAYLDNWFDAIVVRTPELDDLAALAVATDARTVNARTRQNHPCEILGDLAFLASTGRDLTEPMVLTFVGEATNLLRSWQEAARVLPIDVRHVCPPSEAPLDDAIDGADVLYTDCWPSDIDEDRRAAFAEVRITAEVLDRAPADLVFLPCPPVSRGDEVSADAMHHEKCRVVEAKAWLLHAQNALLVEGLSLR